MVLTWRRDVGDELSKLVKRHHRHDWLGVAWPGKWYETRCYRLKFAIALLEAVADLGFSDAYQGRQRRHCHPRCVR